MGSETLNAGVNSVERRLERIGRVAKDLLGGRLVTDLRFDQVYPPWVRRVSEIHWTPVDVAIRAVELLAVDEKTRVLDVGSGSGKFCIVGALSSQARFIGIEQRPHLVEASRKAGRELGAERASFILGNMAGLDWTFFDAFYLFNPFYENKMKSIRIDESVSHSLDRFTRYIEIVRTKLKMAKPGTKVATYHGFGGDFPMGYRLLQKEPIGSSCLEVWSKVM